MASERVTAVEEVYNLLLSQPTLEQIIAFHASEAAQRRLRDLLALNEAGQLSEADAAELDAYQRVESLMVTLKAKARVRQGQTVRTIPAIYENGHLRLLEPVDWSEGQRVTIQVTPISEDELLRIVLADMDIYWHNPHADSNPWLEDMAEEIRNAYTGDKPLSQIIIEDRGEL